MIIKLEFDCFFTTIKTPDIDKKELKKGIYNKFEKWLKSKRCYKNKTRRNYGLVYDDKDVMEWLLETKFKDKQIEVLEYKKGINEDSNYTIDETILF